MQAGNQRVAATALSRTRKSSATLVVVGAAALLSGLIGWSAREWTQPQPRLPEHRVAGTVSSVDANGICLMPDDINAQPTCASRVALAPVALPVRIGSRMHGSYSVFPGGDDDSVPGAFIWVTLQPTD